ncbi:MAG TPA: hypothetical protein DEB25_08870 [Desulfobulbaceae bacterium]|nr:hypothetical protein [Desulfobulbaceae bacterium]
MQPRFAWSLFLSIGVSLLMLSVLIHAFSSTSAEFLPRLARLLASANLLFIALYVVAGFAQNSLRALRYQMILKTGEDNIPGFFHIFTVTLTRSMFVDLLPARLGELTFVAMLNRGYRVGAGNCLSALSLSFLFDMIALGILLIALIFFQLFDGKYQPWMLGTLIAIFLFCLAAVAALFPLAGKIRSSLDALQAEQWKYLGKLVKLFNDTVEALRQAAQAGIVGKTLLLSLGVRICKYLGLYALFLGIVLPEFSDIDTSIGTALAALLSGEAGAALPVPAFMGFGSYEFGGSLALIALGANKTAALLIMLAIHLWSQGVDYTLGIAALLVFSWVTARRGREAAGMVKTAKKNRIAWVLTLAVLILGLGFFAYQLRGLKKLGSFTPPPPGHALEGTAPATGTALAEKKGFIVWSSNRFGNHDILKMTLPEREISRLTTHPHAEYYPRISPTGEAIVFARAHEVYVSQRNFVAWDVILLNLQSGEERIIAQNSTAPTWSKDGRSIRYQKNGNQVAEYFLATGKEHILAAAGKNIPVPADTELQTPSWSDERRMLATAMRAPMPTVFVIQPGKELLRLGEDSCEIFWGPDSAYLYHVGHDVGHDGKQTNVFKRIDPNTWKSEKWFDFPGEYSHEYFPKVDNTGKFLIYGASSGGHEHDQADYEIFVWAIGSPTGTAERMTFHTGNDNWPDMYLGNGGFDGKKPD